MKRLIVRAKHSVIKLGLCCEAERALPFSLPAGWAAWLMGPEARSERQGGNGETKCSRCALHLSPDM